jgi:hypothetical protein
MASLPVALVISQTLAFSSAIRASLALSAAEGALEHPESKKTRASVRTHNFFI